MGYLDLIENNWLFKEYACTGNDLSNLMFIYIISRIL